jgi:two-component system, cell cycle response regulator DivK
MVLGPILAPNLLHIPIVAVTGHATSDELNRAMAAGCQDYIIKPIDYEQLITKVQSNTMT